MSARSNRLSAWRRSVEVGFWRAVFARHNLAPHAGQLLQLMGIGCSGTVFYKPAQALAGGLLSVPALRFDPDGAHQAEGAVLFCSGGQVRCDCCPGRQRYRHAKKGIRKLGLESEQVASALDAQHQPDHADGDRKAAQVGDADEQAERLAIDFGHADDHTQARALLAPTLYAAAYQPSVNPLEQARRTVVRAYMGFGSAGARGQPTGFRANSNRSGTTPARDWMNWPDALRAVVQRLVLHACKEHRREEHHQALLETPKARRQMT